MEKSTRRLIHAIAVILICVISVGVWVFTYHHRKTILILLFIAVLFLHAIPYLIKVSQPDEPGQKRFSRRSGYWTCPVCSKSNNPSVRTCACGTTKTFAFLTRQFNEPNSWKCKFCDEVNPDNIDICHCGHGRAESGMTDVQKQ